MDIPIENKVLHRPIFLKEILGLLQVSEAGTYVDATLGDGGHTLAILNERPGHLISVDRDAQTLELFKKRQAETFLNHEIKHEKMSEFSQSLKPNSLDGVLIDLGVSTRQLLTPERGFSFREAGPIDMRMGEGPTLLEVLHNIDEETLADALYHYAEVKGSRSIAKKLKQKVLEGTLKTTLDIAEIFPPKKPYEKIHPATQTFLALRMLVNEELEEIEVSIPRFIEALKVGGRLIVLTFHSVEDRLLKFLLKKAAGRCVCEERICQCSKERKVKWIEKITSPSAEELSINPRARSTRLRAVEKNAILT